MADEIKRECQTCFYAEKLVTSHWQCRWGPEQVEISADYWCWQWEHRDSAASPGCQYCDPEPDELERRARASREEWAEAKTVAQQEYARYLERACYVLDRMQENLDQSVRFREILEKKYGLEE
jgi:hypothetical protein